jgi:hypothetical protein
MVRAFSVTLEGMDRAAGPDPATTSPMAPVEDVDDAPVSSRAVMAGLGADPRLPIWIRRAVVSLLVGLVVLAWQDWRWGVTAAAVVAIADTLYQSKTMSLIPAAARVSSAQRRTRRRLYLIRPRGYLSVHTRGLPGTSSVLDHLVIGPAGVYALDSERWDRRLPVRTVASDAGAVLYHGPFSQKDRLAHARWEAAQASQLLSKVVGREVRVHSAMVIYGPVVPWRVTTLRGVDVFAGRNLGKYFRARNRAARREGGSPARLSWEQAGEIYNAAQRVLPRA